MVPPLVWRALIWKVAGALGVERRVSDFWMTLTRWVSGLG
jgi:hypothetical protein